MYDGFDHVIEHRKLTDTGALATTRYVFDALDRTVSKTTGAGTAGAATTEFAYLGLTGQLLEELDAATDAVQARYTYSATGERLGQSKKTSAGVWEDSFYGYNAHSDVETLTKQDGSTRATYGYSAYGSDDTARFTGIDKPTVGEPGAEGYNVYRFNAKRWDAASGVYDMGFRDYDPGLNRFTTRDMYNGALADLNLAADPFNGNRYGFAGGNPINRIELDGHRPIEGNDYSPGSITLRPPTVTNSALQEALNNTYAKPGERKVIGNGKASAALLHEKRTGEMTRGAGRRTYFHHLDVLELARKYAGLLEADRKARLAGGMLLSVDEQTIARREFAELWDALKAEDVAGKVEEHINANESYKRQRDANRRLIDNSYAVRDITGQPFEQVHPDAPPMRVKGAPASRILGNMNSVLIGFDVYWWWQDVGSIMNGTYCGLGGSCLNPNDALS
ncbi:RHS repeat-associated core domain-containing protein [Intrasporangium calvum]|uniref:RHS repeat-associated core domain-containing protein n=1 Tax=Intrasporangium calvum TaxID=53358 RepID=UPI0002D89D45|nr:RHS repeat-associated core domain-containing protein [Intrasporangium calvum]